MRLLLGCTFLLLAAGTQSVNAASFLIQGSDDGTCGNASFESTSSGPIAPIFRSLLADCANGNIEIAANAGTGFLGVLAKATFVAPVVRKSVYASAFARATTTFMVEGPAGNVPLSLNLSLDSRSSGSDGWRGMGLFLGNFGIGSIQIGPTGFVSRGGSIVLPDIDCQPCNLTTPEVMVPANTPLEFILQISVQTERPRDGAQGTTSIDALNTLTFPDGRVFNLPEGYTASIEGMGVVGNQFVRAVPELPTAALMWVGFGLLLRRLRRR